MAKSFACLIFILFILSNQVFYIEGRFVSKGMNLKDGSSSNGNINVVNLKQRGLRRLDQDEGDEDSFRPTAPGNSPGIGHSKHD